MKKNEEPVAPVTPVIPQVKSGMRSPEETAKLPTAQDFTPSADPRNNGGAAIHVTPPSDPKPESTDAKPPEPKPQ